MAHGGGGHGWGGIDLGGSYGSYGRDPEYYERLRAAEERKRFEKFTSVHDIHKDSKSIFLGSSKRVASEIALWDEKNILDKDIEYISQYAQNLNKLRICKLTITNLSTGVFSGSPLLFPRLEVLHISKCHRLRTFRIVAPLLKKLKIFNNSLLQNVSARVPFSTNIIIKPSFPKIKIERDLEDSDLTLISGVTVDTLDLSYCKKITDVGLKYLKSVQIRKLVLRGCPTITQNSLDYLFDSLSGIEEFTLSECSEKIPLSLIFSKNLQKLKYINFSDHPGSFDESVSVNNLEHKCLSLSLSNCVNLTDVTLASLKYLPNLKNLRLNNNQRITNEGIFHLQFIPLEKLSIAKCKQITNDGLKALEKIKTLQIVNVKGCPQITLQDIQLLKQAIPGIKIIHD